jgi:integrase/recombinase XerD
MTLRTRFLANNTIQARPRAADWSPPTSDRKDLSLLHQDFLAEQRYSARLSPATLRGYSQSFARLQSLLPSLTLDHLTPALMTDFFRKLESRRRSFGRGREAVGVKNSTVATYRSKLSRFFRWLEEKKYIAGSPFAGLSYPHVTYEDRQYLDRASVERIFSALVLEGMWRSSFVRRRNLALFSLFLYTGIRRGELLGLRVPDVDLDRLELLVRPETSKSRLRRVVPISSRLCLVLKDYLNERARLRVQSEYLITSLRGVPFTHDGLKHLVNHVRRLSGVTFHVHQFRHTFAVNVLNQGADIATLKQLLGHRDVRMTSQYLRCLPTTALRTDVERLRLDTLLA